MKRTTTVKTLAIAAVTALTLVIAPAANAQNKVCSTAALKGTFVHTASGFVTSPGMAAPFAGVGTDTFDGNGHFAGAATVSINGNPIPLTETGTYKVNPDCTGTYTAFSGAASTTAFFVITDSGNEIQAICTDAGVVISHVFRRQVAGVGADSRP